MGTKAEAIALMLAYMLAIIIAIGSFTFYIAAFFVPELHRRQDFFWSGLGLFYALVLWFCAGRITGAVLLGQVVSVALLGGLGWHTLTLRRDLTPDLVQTPVTWQNLEQWVQDLQNLVGRYLQLEAVANRLKAVGVWLSQLWARFRARAASSQKAETTAAVPPLKRSPAYEFETAPGAGQTVPSEFASVASRERAVAEATPPTAPPSGIAESAAEPTEEPDGESAALAELVQAEPQPERMDGAQSAEPKFSSSSDDESLDATLTTPAVADTVQSTEATDTVAPAASAAAAAPSQTASPQAAGWLERLTARFRQPKSQRTAIEIPRRPPSIPRSPQAEPTFKSASETANETSQRARGSQSQRGVINIPSRPPSIPRSPAARQSTSATVDNAAPAANDETNWDDANWTDVGEVSEAAESALGERDASETEAAPAATNWPDSPASAGTQPAQPKSSAAETNWPEDDDTNWPD
ncbi:MAG: Ycf66 family protein [Cyanobacteria bacterium P01_C01_bin.120]